MTKNSFLATLFLIIVVGCAKVGDNAFAELIDMYDSNSINFASTTTKAISNDIDTMESDANGFVVYGLELNATSWYDNLDGNRYIYNPASQIWEWETSDAPSWPTPFSQMNFYALYPESAIGFTLIENAPSSIIGDITVEPSILDQTDYLASCSGDIVSKPISGMQPLSFAHIMSKISFSITQEEGVLTVIRQLGIENVINTGSYDYINSEWYNLSNKNVGSFSDYVGSSGPFAKYGVADQVDAIRIDGHELMLIPQSGGQDDNQTPIWDGSVTLDDSGDLEPSGAYISIRYRTNSDTEDLVGYALRDSSLNDTEWTEGSYFHSVYKKVGGTYTGPLFIKAAFKLTTQQLAWVAGTEYDYTLQLDQAGGIHLSEFYYDVDGQNTKIRIDGTPQVGDLVFTTDLTVGIVVNNWK